MVGHADPPHPAVLHRRDDGHPESKVRVIAPDVGGGFGGKLQTTPEEFITLAVARRSASRASTPRPARSRWCPATTAATSGRSSPSSAEKDGTVTGLKVELLADIGAYVGARRRRRPGPRCVDVQLDLQVPGVPLQRHERTHQQDLGRRLPWRRPPGGHVRHRAAHGRARRRGRGRPPRDPREELDHARGVPLHHRGRDDVRLGQLRGGDGAGQGALRLRRAAGRAEAAPRGQRPGPARHRRLDVHRDVRAGPLPGARLPQLRGGRLGARDHPDAHHGQGRGRHRHVAPRPGPRDRVEPDRRRPARRPVRGRRGPPRRHPDRAQGPGHLRLTVARRRW